jgi:hypothetical protein
MIQPTTLSEAAGGDGARHLGHSRKVFEKHYRDVRLVGASQLDKLPALTLPVKDAQKRLF